MTNSYHFPRPWRWESVPLARGVFQHIQSIFLIESNAENGGEPTGGNCYLAVWCDLEDLGRAPNNRESVQVSYKEVAIVLGNSRRHDVTLAGRNINDPRDL